MPDQSTVHIAYFSMEVGIDPKVPTYSGGLGILAGDTIRAAADLGIPMVAVTLLTREGYFKQGITRDGRQRVRPEIWDVRKQLKSCRLNVTLGVQNRKIKIRVWCYEAVGIGGAVVPVYYLDTDVPGNTAADRVLSHQLYGGDQDYRLLQEWVLGAGGVQVLRALGHRNLHTYHMNEGHAAFLSFELLAQRCRKGARPTKADIAAVTKQCIFTTHTPVTAGHDRFDLKRAQSLIGDHPAWRIKRHFIHEKNTLNMTLLAMAFSRYINAVARKHGEVSQAMFPDYPIDAITNGVHVPTWTSDPLARLFDQYTPGWLQDNNQLRFALAIPTTKLRQAHRQNKARLLDLINRKSAVSFKPRTLTIGFARRATAYKRADLILRDLDELQGINREVGKIQIVFAGKAHPRDLDGQRLIQNIVTAARDLIPAVPVVYLPDYNMKLSQILIPGVDLWLNNPEPPHEASGTSGMKASLNGVPNLSILDGWWIEGHCEDVTGWAIDEVGKKQTDRQHAHRLYEKLRHVVDLYYHDPKAFLQICRNTIALNSPYFSTQRMVQDYVRKAYSLRM